MVKKIFLILILIVLLFCCTGTTKVLGLGEIIGGSDEWIDKGKSQQGTPINQDNLDKMSEELNGTLLTIGTVVAVIIAVILGIQFITGSVEQKVKVKESLVPFVTGCVVIFGAFGIWRLVIIILR